MAIDSTLFMATVPAGTYAVGDRVNLGVIRGPAIVRDGYGKAILKKIICLNDTTGLSGKITVHVKNSNWIDDLSNPAVGNIDTVLANTSGAIQPGHDAVLVPNSGWEVYGIFNEAATTNGPSDVFALIDVDYPSVQAIEDPREAQGVPVTIDWNRTIAHTITAVGGTPVWTTVNVDVFKAGYKYLLDEAAFVDGSNLGFFSISNAAGQQGLERIIPCRTANLGGIKYYLDYSTPLVKGPMNVNFLSFGVAGSANIYAYLDCVRR